MAWHLRDTVDPFFTTSSPDPGCLVSDGATERNKINEKKCNVILICPLLHKVHLNDNCLLDCIYTSAVILMAMRVLFLSELHLYCLCNKQYIDIFVAFVSLNEYKIGCLKMKK